MLETDITFMIFMGIGCIIFTLFIFIWRGIIWLSFISGAFWILYGLYFTQRTQEGVVLMQFQEYLPIMLIGIGIAMILSPMWLSAKQMDAEKDAPNDINVFGERNYEEDLSEFGIKRKSERNNRRY